MELLRQNDTERYWWFKDTVNFEKASWIFFVATLFNFQYGFHEREVFPAHREIVVAVNELDSITGSSGTIAWELVRPVKILFSSKTTF